jgi:hypothetical protein
MVLVLVQLVLLLDESGFGMRGATQDDVKVGRPRTETGTLFLSTVDPRLRRVAAAILLLSV